MTDTSLATVYAGWEIDQQHLITAIAPLAEEQLTLRAAPHLRTVGEIVAHIISARAWWFYGTLAEGEVAPMTEFIDWDDDDHPPVLSRDELLVSRLNRG